MIRHYVWYLGLIQSGGVAYARTRYIGREAPKGSHTVLGNLQDKVAGHEFIVLKWRHNIG